MWPTVLNTAVGVRADPAGLPQRGARPEPLPRASACSRSSIPATLPYMFTGFRLSLGIAWLVIVAVEMLTGAPGIGGFLWQEYNSLIYEHIIALHRHHRRDRVRARQAHGRRRAALPDGLSAWRASSSRASARASDRAGRARRCCATSTSRSSRASSWPSSGTSGAGKTTLISMIAGPARSRTRARSRWTARPSPGPDPTAAWSSRTTRSCPGSAVYENVLLAVDQVFPDWPTARRRGARPESTSRW